ncbi:hypothetical protein, partial [Burkholderia ubonensis]|uniref:hypothetical protein n=1 Tax=Burkholderia ubonensis TaxID=101571 RepID=UPI001C4326D4
MRIISKDLKLFKNQRVVTNCQGFWGVLRGFLQSIAGVWTLSALCNARIALGPAPANNGLANVPCRPQCKEHGAPFGRAKQATR